jgi:hypothetical protein
MNSSRSMQNPSSSRPGQAPDQHSMRQALQSCVEHLNRLDHCVHEDIQEIRSIFMGLLDNCQSDVIMGDSGRYDSIVDSQVGLDWANVIPAFVPQPAPHSTSFEFTGSLSEGTGLPQGKFAVSTTFPLNTYLYEQAHCLAAPAVLPTIGPLLNLPQVNLSTACTMRPFRHPVTRML